jgi:hypothetical protein
MLIDIGNPQVAVEDMYQGYTRPAIFTAICSTPLESQNDVCSSDLPFGR